MVQFRITSVRDTTDYVYCDFGQVLMSEGTQRQVLAGGNPITDVSCGGDRRWSKVDKYGRRAALDRWEKKQRANLQSLGESAGREQLRKESTPFENRYEPIQALGEGTYGVVYEGVCHATGRKVALKRIRVDSRYNGLGFSLPALRETALLRELDHPNIVQLLDAFYWDDAQLWLVFELCDQDLHSYLKALTAEQKVMQKSSFHASKNSTQKDVSAVGMPSPMLHGILQPLVPMEQCQCLTRQLLQGISYCHSRCIIHRDLKPQNILLNASGVQLKIADLGLARTISNPLQPCTHEVVTLWYRPPELLLGEKHYTTALDIWSVGCIVAELVAGRPLFYGDCEADTLFKIFRILGTPVDEEGCEDVPTRDKRADTNNACFPVWKNVSRLQYYAKEFPRWRPNPRVSLKAHLPGASGDLIDFLARIFQYDPLERPTACDALTHPWLAIHTEEKDTQKRP